MIEFDFSRPESREQMLRSLDTVGVIDILDDRLSGDVEAFAEPGSYLALLSSQLPEAPVNLIHSLRAGLSATRGSLDQIRALFEAGEPVYRTAMFSMTRSALLGAARVIFVLGPDDRNQQLQNARTVLHQEGASFLRGLEGLDKFEQLEELRPPDGLIARTREQVGALGGSRIPGEWNTINNMAGVVGQQLALSQRADTVTGEALAEHVAYIWNAYSGEAHAFGWPGILPGDFVADFGYVTSVSHLSFAIAVKKALRQTSA